MKKFQIFSRYDHPMFVDGQLRREFTKWFPITLKGAFDTKKEAEEVMKAIEKEDKATARKMKEKHEYEVREINWEPYHYVHEPPKEPKKRGRKPKVKTEE